MKIKVNYICYKTDISLQMPFKEASLHFRSSHFSNWLSNSPNKDSSQQKMPCVSFTNIGIGRTLGSNLVYKMS